MPRATPTTTARPKPAEQPVQRGRGMPQKCGSPSSWTKRANTGPGGGSSVGGAILKPRDSTTARAAAGSGASRSQARRCGAARSCRADRDLMHRIGPADHDAARTSRTAGRARSRARRRSRWWRRRSSYCARSSELNSRLPMPGLPHDHLARHHGDQREHEPGAAADHDLGHRRRQHDAQQALARASMPMAAPDQSSFSPTAFAP